MVALKAEIEGRITQLVDMLLEDLKTLSGKKFERRRIIGFLVRLKRADKALQIFLQNRSLTHPPSCHDDDDDGDGTDGWGCV